MSRMIPICSSRVEVAVTCLMKDLLMRRSKAVVKRLPGPKVAQRYMGFEQAGEYSGVTQTALVKAWR